MRSSFGSPLTRPFLSVLGRASALGNRTFFVPHRPDELSRVPTEDGSTISLGRYHPRTTRRFQEPVVLCHGLGVNRFNLDLDEDYSLARFLARRGFETWVLELRGRGLAGPPTDATFDDQAEHDVGAALRVVYESGADQVHWVGHSKGGLLLFAHMAKRPTASIRSAVALASPVTMRFQPGLKEFIRAISPLLGMPVIPAGIVSFIAPLGPVGGPIPRYLAKMDNMDPLVLRKAMANMSSHIPGGVGRQFARWIQTGRFDSADGSVDYLKELQSIRFPVLLVAAPADLLAPPEAVFLAKEHLGGPVETWIAGTASGLSTDYGHGDLVLGRAAPQEVFPKIEAFLAQHSTPA